MSRSDPFSSTRPRYSVGNLRVLLVALPSTVVPTTQPSHLLSLRVAAAASLRILILPDCMWHNTPAISTQCKLASERWKAAGGTAGNRGRWRRLFWGVCDDNECIKCEGMEPIGWGWGVGAFSLSAGVADSACDLAVSQQSRSKDTDVSLQTGHSMPAAEKARENEECAPDVHSRGGMRRRGCCEVDARTCHRAPAEPISWRREASASRCALFLWTCAAAAAVPLCASV
eukprot:2626812-Rhodomonas_salina.3